MTRQLGLKRKVDGDEDDNMSDDDPEPTNNGKIPCKEARIGTTAESMQLVGMESGRGTRSP